MSEKPIEGKSIKSLSIKSDEGKLKGICSSQTQWLSGGLGHCLIYAGEVEEIGIIMEEHCN